MGDKTKLTSKQRKFIEAYSGNATEAARLAGYAGDENALGVAGYDLLRNPKIAEVIKSRESKELKKLIATRTDRQEFWTKAMMDPELEMYARLRASELLGKSEADFIEKVEHSGSVGLESKSDEDLDRRIEELENALKGKPGE